MDEKNIERRNEILTDPISQQDSEVTLDFAKLAKALLRRSWVLILAAAIFGGIAFTYFRFFATPLYSASSLIYVQNSEAAVVDAQQSVSSSDLTASNTLAEVVILYAKSRTTMEEVITQTGLHYTPEELGDMITVKSQSVKSVLKITVEGTVPEETEIISSALNKVLVENVPSTLIGCSIRVLDKPVIPDKSIYPQTLKMSVFSAILGAFLAAVYILIRFYMDDIFHSVDDVKQYYHHLPVLGAVPDFGVKSSGGYGGYRKGSKKEQ